MKSRKAFTLMEVMIVVGIIAVLSATVMPRFGLGVFNERPVTAFQRAIESASELAMSGVSVRFVLKTGTVDSDFSDGSGAESSGLGTGALPCGKIVVEAYVRQETESDLSKFLGTSGPTVLAWTPIELKHAPAGNRWLMEPGVIYFFTDGSCTPARVSWVQSELSYGANAQDVFYLTVTGYCATPPEQQGYWY